MRKIILLLPLATFTIKSKSQNINGFGIEVSGSSNKTLTIDGSYIFKNNAITAGMSRQFNGQKGKLIKERLDNYGTTVTGSGYHYWTIDVGYARLLNEQFTIGGELSLGGKNHYLNYSDKKFKSGGFHEIDKRNGAIGCGGYVIYNFSKVLGVVAGYNTLKDAILGISIRGI